MLYHSTAQKPDVAIYNSNIQEIKQYSVDEGREFRVLCLSNGTYRGTVAWKKINSDGGMCFISIRIYGVTIT